MTDEYYRDVLDHLTVVGKSFPKHASKIEAHWGSEQGHQYLKGLLVKNREERKGFSLEVFNHLFELYLLHEKKNGDYESPLVLKKPNRETQ